MLRPKPVGAVCYVLSLAQKMVQGELGVTFLTGSTLGVIVAEVDSYVYVPATLRAV